MANRWSNEPILCKYALKTNSIITYVNYRLAPEYKHPTAVYDCYDCLKFLLEHKADFHIDDKQVILMGDSAGGMICFSIAQLARDETHRNLFKKMVLIYPAMDNRKVPDDDLSWDERNMIYDNTFGLQYKTGEVMSRWYFPSWESVNSPLGSPIVCEDYANFPPVRIFTIFSTVCSLSPGLTLSGEYPAKKSSFSFSPDTFSITGMHSSSVTPG